MVDFLVDLWNVFSRFHSLFLKGAWMTIWLSLVAVLGGTILGGVVSVARMSKHKWVSAPITWIVNFIRGTPLLVQLFFFANGMFSVLNNQGIRTSDLFWCLFALILNSGAYVSEIFRAGIQAVDKGQTEAALSLGLSQKHTLWRVIMPQAIKNIVPALGNEFVSMIKETSLVSTFFLGELTTAYRTISTLYIIIEPLIIISIIYYLLTSIMNFLLKKLERRLSVSD